MNKSETTGKLAAALSNAQSLIKGALKDSANPFFRSKYADLESVWEACKEALTLNQLAVTQTFGIDNGHPVLDTTLLHSSGEWISGRQLLVTKEMTSQGLGAASTYARRFGLAAIVGVVQTDDDGETAMGRSHAPEHHSKTKRPFDPKLAPPAKEDPFFENALHEIKDAQTESDLKKTWSKYSSVIATLPLELQSSLVDAKEEKKKAILFLAKQESSFP